MLGFSEPLAAGPLAFALGPDPDNTFNALIADADAPGQYLVEISAFRGGDVRLGARTLLADGPLGAFGLGSIPYAGEGAGAEVQLRFSDLDWVGDPTDEDKPNVYYEGRVSVPLRMTRLMPVTPEAPRHVQRQFGEIELINADGELDGAVQSYAVDGRRVRVLYGPAMGSYKNFAVIADAVGQTWQSATEAAVRLAIRDRTYSLETQLQTNLYDGAGGAGGTTELEGKPIPLLFGRACNIVPVLLDPVNLIYQFHDGAAHAVDAVYDQGLALDFDAVAGNVASYAALVSASVSAGDYATCLEQGLFKLGSSPAGLITMDARGSTSPSYQNTLDEIALRLIRDFAGITDSFINGAGFAEAATVGGELGLYIDLNREPSTADVLNELFQACGAWWGAGRDGRLTAGRLADPENGSPIYYFDQYDILELSILPSPTPRYRQSVAFKRNWTVQRGEDLAGAVLDTRRQLLAQPFAVTTTFDAQVRVRHNEALDPPVIASLYHNQSDAEALRDEKFALHKVDRQMFEMTVRRLGYRFDLGRIVNVSFPRFGLEAGKRFVIVGIDENGRNDQTIIRLWG